MSTENGVQIKDLRVIQNRSLQDMVMVDNSACAFGLNIGNGVPIIPFYDNLNDVELLDLIPYLKYLVQSDIVTTNTSVFRMQKYKSYTSYQPLIDYFIHL